jgi:hypothetical protein
VTIGLAASLAAVLACAGVLLAARRRRPPGAAAAETQGAAETPVRIGEDPTVASVVKLGIIASSVALLVGPLEGAVVLGVAASQLVVYRRGRPVRIMAMSGLGMAAYVAVAVAVIERRKAPFPNAGWTNSFEHLNGLALTAVALVAASTMLNPLRNQT